MSDTRATLAIHMKYYQSWDCQSHNLLNSWNLHVSLSLIKHLPTLGLPFKVTNLMSSTECHIDFWIGPHWLTGFRQNPFIQDTGVCVGLSPYPHQELMEVSPPGCFLVPILLPAEGWKMSEDIEVWQIFHYQWGVRQWPLSQAVSCSLDIWYLIYIICGGGVGMINVREPMAM